jgi:hypothetical protein
LTIGEYTKYGGEKTSGGVLEKLDAVKMLVFAE